MKRLVCEMCGSADVLKHEGLFVCQVCGCKYTLEEARKMMVEGTVEVTGTVTIDQSETVGNYRALLDNAINSGNNQQAELYCNKIIEIDPSNWYAWLRKGHAAGWQSTLANLRISEAIACYGSSLNCTNDEEERETIINCSKQDIQSMCLACVNLQLERFAKWPDEEETASTLQIILAVSQNMISYITTMMVSMDLETLMVPIASEITNTVISTWNNYITREYVNDDDTGHPGKYAYSKLLDRAHHCQTLLLKTIELSKHDDESDIERYESLIAINLYCMNNCAWDYHYTTEYLLGVPYTHKNWYRASTLTNEAVNSRQRANAQYQNNITEIKRQIAARKAEQEREKARIEQEEKDARVATYWASHPVEKQKLDSERDELENIVAEFDKLLATLSEDHEIISLQKALESLYRNKKSLSRFNLKQRKDIQEQIDEANDKLNDLKIKKEAALQARRRVALQQIEEIDAELKRDR